MENVKTKHLPKKLLCVLLSVMMIVSTMTVGLSVIAEAATSAATVKSKVDAAATLINGKTPSSNAYTYTGDDGKVMAAAEAVYDYAVNSVRQTGNTANYNSSDTLASRVQSLSGANSAAITKLINPTGTTVYGYANRQSKSGSYTVNKVTGGSFDKGKLSYPTNVADDVTKTITVTADLDKVLCTYSSVTAIPATILLKVTYKYTHASATDYTSSRSNASWKDYKHSWTAYKWNYLSSVTRTVNSQNTTAKTELTAFNNYFNASVLATPVSSMINETFDALQSKIDTTKAQQSSMESKYSQTVLQHFFGADYKARTQTYLDNLAFAQKVVLAMPSINILVENVGKDYDKNNLEEMNNLSATVVNAYDTIKDYDDSVFEYVAAMGAPYDTFALSNCTAYVAQLKIDIALCQLRALKAAIDADCAAYADKVSDPLNDNDITDLELAAVIDKFNGYINTVNSYMSDHASEVSAVFTDGTAYITELRDAAQKKADTRSAEVQYDNFYEYFIPYLFADITVWSNAEITDRYTLDSAKNNTVKSTYNTYKSKVGDDIVNTVFTMNYHGEDMLLQGAVDIYLESLKTNIIARNNAQIDEIAEYSGTSTTVTLDNYMGIKGAIGQFDQDLYNYANGKGWVDASHKSTYSKINTLLTNYNNFIATGGLNNFSQKHNHNSSGVFTTRPAGSQGNYNDIARDGADDNYDVTEKAINTVISKLDKFLTSNEVAYLLSSFDEPLDEFLMRTIADELYTDKTVNMLMGILYPMLCKTFEDVWAGLPATYDVPVIGEIKISYTDMKQTISNLGLGTYPQQVAAKMNSTFSAAKTAMNGASSWDKLTNEDGDLTLVWGIDDINADNYSSMNAYYTAKANRFKSALSQGLEALAPVLKALLAEYNYSASVDGVAKASKKIPLIGNVSLNANLDISVDPVAGYSLLIAPIFEAIGITPKTQAEAKNLTSVSAIINAIIDPISSFVTGTLASAPITTILNILPNVLYGLSFDRLSALINNISTAIHYNAKGDIYVTEISVIDDKYDIRLGELVNLNELIKDENENPIALTDVNALIGYLAKSFLPEANLDLPVINGGKIIESASVNKNASTRRAAAAGSRINFTADKADEFYVILNWLVRALGDSTFVHELLYALSGETPADEILALVNNISNDADAVLAALVELIVPQKYDFMDYDWYESAYTYETVEGLEAADIAYLKYSNNWTKDKAEYIVDNIDEVVAALMTIGEDSLTLNESLQQTISKVFNNEGITGIVKALVTLGTAIDDEKIVDLIEREIGLDVTVWADAFGYLFPEVLEKKEMTPVLPTDAAYVNNTGVTGVADVVDGETVITWSKDGAELQDGDRTMFLDIFCALCEDLSPVVKLILTGEDLSAFAGLITIKGYDTYENSIAVLFEALGIEVMSASEYEAYCDEHGAVEAFNALCQQLSDWIDYILTDNTVKKIIGIIPNAIYFIESNGLAAVLHNLLMPLLVLVDDVRPIIDVDANSILSYILTTLANGREIDGDTVLAMLFGEAEVEIEEGDKVLEIDVNNLRLTDLLKLADAYLGTDLTTSELAVYGIPAICAGRYAYESASGKTGYKTSVSEADALTIVLSSVIEALEHKTASGQTNGDVIFALVEELTGKDDIKTIYNKVLSVFDEEVTALEDLNWTYMYGEEFTTDDLKAESLPAQTTEILNMLGYSNNWTEDTAKYVDENLDDIIATVLKAAGESEDYVSVLLTALIEDNVYTNDVINALISVIAKLFVNLDKSLLKLIDVVLGTNVTSWFDYCEFEYNEEGKVSNVTCTKDWGVTDKDSFIAAFNEAAEPAYGLIGWLFLGTDYDFGTGTKKDADGNFIYNDLLTIKGSEGYNYALVPVLEALGCETPAASEFLGEDGNYDIEKAVSAVLNALLTRVDEITADPVNEILNVLPNVLYFINADGVKVCFNNLLAPINGLVAKINGTDSENIAGSAEGVDLSDLTTENILALIENGTGLNLTEAVKMIIGSFYIGDVEYFTSVNGKPAFRMHYSEKGDRKDMITILVTVLLLVIDEKENEPVLKDALGEDVYTAILNVLDLVKTDMQKPSWIFTEYADTDKVFSAFYTSELYEGYSYGPIYTEEMAQYIATNIDRFIDNLIYLLGIKVNGVSVDNLKDVLNAALDGSVYNSSVAQKLLDAVKSLAAKVDEIEGSKHIKALIKKSLGVDLDAWDNFEIPEFDNDKAKFTETICDILEPLYPVLKCALCDENFSFFVDEKGEDVVTLLGAEGYAYGIIPILEALGCEGIMTQAEYYAAAQADGDAMIMNILNPLLDKVDDIMTAPADKILEILPAIIYFVNSNGLDTCFKNALHAVYTLLDAIEPLVKVDLYELINFRLDEVTFASLYNLLIDEISKSTGYDLTPLKGDALKELTLGKLVSFTSKNGETAYTMVYQSESAKADMVTIILRLVIRFIMTEQNMDKLVGILKDNFDMSADAEKYLKSFLYLLADYTVSTRLGMDKALASVYYVFLGVDIAANETATALKKVDVVWEEALANLETEVVGVKDRLDEILAEITNKVQDGVNDTNDKIDETLGGVQDKVDETLDDIKDKVQDGVNDTNDKIDETLNDTQNKVDETLDDVKDKVEGGVNDVNDKLDGVADELNGVNNQMNGIFAKILAFFRDLVAKLRSLFGGK